MPRGFNTALSTDSHEDDSWQVMQEAQFGDTFENEASQEVEKQSPEETVEDAAERVAFTEQGAQTIKDLKDRYGEQYEDFKENAKAKLRGFGRAAGAMTKKAGLFVVGAGVVGVTAGIAAAGRARQNRRDRKANRQAIYEKRIQQQRDEVYDEAVRDNELYDLETEAIAENERYDDAYDLARNYFEGVKPGDTSAFNAEFISEDNIAKGAEKKARQDVLNDTYDEAFAGNEQFDEAKAEAKAQERIDYEARVAARYARFVAYQRRAARRQKYESVRNKGSEIYQKASSKTRQLGRAIASFAKRTGSAVAAGAREAKASWQETAA